jgi:RNA polymerase sigma factor (sigma-70 family)
VALNFLRKRRREEVRRQRREHRAARPEPLHASPQEVIERVEVRRQVLEAVLGLEEPYRSTLVQRYFEDMSVREIAQAARIPASTVTPPSPRPTNGCGRPPSPPRPATGSPRR